MTAKITLDYCCQIWSIVSVLDFNRMAGNTLADYLNRWTANIKDHPWPADQAAVRDYVRWAKHGRRADHKAAARPLAGFPFKGHINVLQTRLDFVPRHHLDAALWCLVELSRAGELRRMRECSKCGKWFYAKSTKSLFCSTNCKAAHWAAHQGRKRCALQNRKWRIQNFNLPNTRLRIQKLEELKGRGGSLAKPKADRLSELRKIQKKLERELSRLSKELGEDRRNHNAKNQKA